MIVFSIVYVRKRDLFLHTTFAEPWSWMVGCSYIVMYKSFVKITDVDYTAVLAGNDTSLTENITQDRKRSIMKSKGTTCWTKH